MFSKALSGLVILSVLLLWIPPTLSGNILLVTVGTFGTPSSYMFLSAITGGLVSKGHNVTLVSNVLTKNTHFPNGTFNQALYYNATYTREDMAKDMAKILSIAYENFGFIGTLRHYSRVFQLNYKSCRDLWNDRTVVDRLKYHSEFDLAIILPLSSCEVLLAHYLEVPFVIVYPCFRSPLFHERFIGMPLPSSYVSFDIFGALSDEMTFFERLKNFLYHPLAYEVFQYFCNKPYFHIQEQFNIHPEKSINVLYQKASLFLAQASLSSDFPRPYTPNVIPIGGLLGHPIEPLTKEIDDFVEDSGDHGVILFTLGSLLKVEDDRAETFAKVFSKLSQRVLWRHIGRPSQLGNNTRLVEWLPQNDLLGHPKTRLLIYHGGANGVGEAIYHGVPMVIIPFSSDQFANAVRVQKKGMGLILAKTNITEESLMSAVKEVLDNPSYKERAQLFSSIHRDDPLTPLERAVYWIEHVMKFGDAHLRPRSADMGVIELYQIDVIGALFILSVIVVCIGYVIIRKWISICCGVKNRKTKSE